MHNDFHGLWLPSSHTYTATVADYLKHLKLVLILFCTFESRLPNAVLVTSFLSKLTELVSSVYITTLQKYSYFLMPEAELKIMFPKYCLFILLLPVLGNYFNTRTIGPLVNKEKCRSYQKKHREECRNYDAFRKKIQNSLVESERSS